MSTTSMKPSALPQKRLLLPLLTAPAVTLALTLLLLQPVQAQQSQRRVSLPNQDYASFRYHRPQLQVRLMTTRGRT